MKTFLLVCPQTNYTRQNPHLVPSPLNSVWDLIRHRGPRFFTYKNLWHPDRPIKISIFLWKMVHNVVRIDLLVQKRGIPFTSKCYCCPSDLAMESIDHLFLFGKMAKEIWNFFSSAMSFHPQALTVVHNMNAWWIERSHSSLRGWLMHMLPPLILWNIWKACNRYKFDNICMPVNVILEMIRADTFNIYNTFNIYILPLEKNLHTSKVDIGFLNWLGLCPCAEKASSFQLVRWIAPPDNWAKLNCDGASKGNIGHSGGSGIIRDSSGALTCVFG